MIDIISLFLIAKIAQQIIYNLYLWQLKEYRFDRVLEHLERTKKNWLSAWVYLTVGAPFSLKKLPKLTGKAILLLTVNFFFLYLVSATGFIATVTALFVTPLFILSSIIIIFPIEWTIRQLVYFLASKRVRDLQKKGLIVIGITGSYGKTTTKSFIDQILSSKFKVLATSASINTPLAISLIILRQLTSSHKFFIVEMGAYKKGEIRELCNITRPDVAIVTGISNQHLALFGSQDKLIASKSEILENLDKNAIILINKSSQFLPKIDKKMRSKINFYGTSQTAKKYCKFKDLATIPDFLKINLEPGLILAQYFQIGEDKVAESLRSIKTPQTVVNIRKSKKGVMVINDSRSSNFKGVLDALDYLKSLKAEKKIVVMPCLIELGEEAAEIHRQIGKRLNKAADLAIVTTDEFFQEIKEGGGPPAGRAGRSDKIILLKETDKILGKLNEFISPESVILIEGRVDPAIIDYYV